MIITDSPNWNTQSIAQLINALESKDLQLMEKKKIKLTIADKLGNYQFSFIRDDFNYLISKENKNQVSKETAVKEILRQRELRIVRHRREWHSDPHNMEITQDDIAQTRKYFNTVEDWSDEYHE
jgi:actin-like ATPase involved in cell morphogenesis